MSAQRPWPVRIDAAAWSIDMRGASQRATRVADAWRRHVERRGLTNDELVACRAEDDGGLDLPRCVKVRLPDPHDASLEASPWGVVLQVRRDREEGLQLLYLAFGQRHPEAAGSRQTSVYERAHRRLFPQGH